MTGDGLNGFPEDVDVRPLGPDDLDAIVELVDECDRTYVEWAPAGWQAPDLTEYRLRWEERLPAADHWTRGAVDASGSLIGMVSFRPEVDTEERPVPGVAHVSAVFVDPGRWREGIASALLRMAEAAFTERGFSLARLWTPEAAPARAFYERCGWRYDGSTRWFDELDLPLVRYERRVA